MVSGMKGPIMAKFCLPLMRVIDFDHSSIEAFCASLAQNSRVMEAMRSDGVHLRPHPTEYAILETDNPETAIKFGFGEVPMA